MNAKRSEAITVVDHAILVRWELADPPKPLRAIYTEHTQLRILASSSDGNHILIWTEDGHGNSEGILELREWETLEFVKRMPQPMEGRVQSAAFSPNGKWVALAIDSQEAVYLIDIDTGEYLSEVPGGEWTASVHFAPSSELLAVACSFQGGATVGIHRHEQVWIENVFEFGRSDYTTPANQFVDTLVDIAFSRDSHFLVLFETSRIYHELYPAGWRGNLALYSACGSTAGCILLYDTASGKLNQRIRVHPDASVISLALDSAGVALWVLLSNGDLISVNYFSVISLE